MSSSQIVCPHCQKSFAVEEALGKHLRDQLESEFSQRLDQEKKIAVQNAQESNQKEIQVIRTEMEEKAKKLAIAESAELKLRKDKLALEEEKRSFEIQKQRAIDEERAKIREQTLNEATDNYRLKEKEWEKKLTDMKLTLDDAQRKAAQGSQQLQGEVAELDIENSIRNEFPTDQVAPVGKGVRGADIVQTVKTSRRNVCGTILYEIKRTKAWANDWPKKLKEDVRSAKANYGVIVSSVMPEEAKSGLGLVDGVCVVRAPLLLSAVYLIRSKLIDVAREKFVAGNQASKSEKLYEFIVSHEFSQQLEAIAEVYQEMNSEITKERASMERIWKTREIQIRRLLTGTANIVGGIRGSGATMPSIKGVDLPSLEEGE